VAADASHAQAPAGMMMLPPKALATARPAGGNAAKLHCSFPVSDAVHMISYFDHGGGAELLCYIAVQVVAMLSPWQQDKTTIVCCLYARAVVI